MAALLVAISVMSVLMSMALPAWSHMIKREKEEELIWRGNQYVRAIALFQRKFANTFPPSVDVLVEQKFLRKKYKDPITNDDFVLLPAGGGMMPGMPPGQAPPGAPPQSGFGQRPPSAPGGGTTQVQTPGQTLNLGIGGVASKSKDTSIRIYNGRQKYNEWAFVALQMAQRVGPGGQQFPGMPMQPGAPGGPMQPGAPGGPMRPGVPGQQGMPPMPPGMGTRPPVPFGPQGQSPFGQPSQPFTQPGQRPPSRPPGN